MKRRTLLGATLALPALASPALLSSALVSPARAQSFPRQPIKLIVPYAAGGTSDAIMRYLAQKLAAVLGQPIIVDNRVGANGTIGLAQGLRSPADGYTLIQISNTNTVAAIGMVRNLTFDPLKDMQSIGSIYNIPTCLLAAADFPAKDFAGFRRAVTANPAQWSYAYSHATGAVTGHSVARALGVDLTAVPYRAGPQMMTDLVGGHIPLVFTDIAIALPLIRSDKIKIFAVTAPERSPLAPEVPTLKELLPAPIEFVGWGGIVGPIGMPPAIVERLNFEMNRILATPEAEAYLAQMGAARMTGTPAFFQDFIQAEAPKWLNALRAAGIEPE